MKCSYSKMPLQSLVYKTASGRRYSEIIEKQSPTGAPGYGRPCFLLFTFEEKERMRATRVRYPLTSRQRRIALFARVAADHVAEAGVIKARARGSARSRTACGAAL
jgi:hypothetical protein